MSTTTKADTSVTMRFADNTTRQLDVPSKFAYDGQDPNDFRTTFISGMVGVNASLEGGTAGGLSSLFVSNDGQPLTNFDEIRVKITTETPIFEGA